MTTATKTPEDTTSMVHANLATALAAFQVEVPSVVKGATATVETKTGGQYKYQYADLAVITPLVLPLLGKNGLAFTSQPTLVGENFVLLYQLTHESGESLDGMYPLPDPVGAKPQEIGSAITYARRYALCAVTGVSPGGDDDDAASANDRPASAPRRTATRKPAAPPAPVASKDWAGMIANVVDQGELKALWEAADGELGLSVSPEHAASLVLLKERHPVLEGAPGNVTVGALIGAVKPSLPENAFVPAEDEPADGWPTAEPGSGGQ